MSLVNYCPCETLVITYLSAQRREPQCCDNVFRQWTPYPPSWAGKCEMCLGVGKLFAAVVISGSPGPN